MQALSKFESYITKSNTCCRGNWKKARMFIKYLQNSNASSYQFNERIIERSSPTFQHICTMHTYFSLKAKISDLQLHHCHSCGTHVGNDQKRQNFVTQRLRYLLSLTQEWVKFLLFFSVLFWIFSSIIASCISHLHHIYIYILYLHFANHGLH